MADDKLTDHYDNVGPGWAALLTALHGDLTAVLPSYSVGQVKEKFGGLRVYLDAYTSDAQGLVYKYETLSFSVCEACGKAGETFGGETKGSHGWIKTYCAPCRAKEYEERHAYWAEQKEKKAAEAGTAVETNGLPDS